MPQHLFVDLLALSDGQVVVYIHTVSLPRDYFEQTCYLCRGSNGNTRLFRHREGGVFTCEHCLYNDGHVVGDWRWYLNSSGSEEL